MAATTKITFPPSPHTHNIEDLTRSIDGGKLYDPSLEPGLVFKRHIRVNGVLLGQYPICAYMYSTNNDYDIHFRYSRESYREGYGGDNYEYTSIITILNRLAALEAKVG